MRSLDGLLDQAAQAPGAVAILAIGGTARVGKMALALYWAHRVAGRFPDGQLFLDLGGYGPDRNPVCPADALRIFMEALQLPADRIPASAQARTGFDDHAWQLPWALELVFYRRSCWHDLQSIQQTALEATTRLGSLTGQAHALRSLGLAQAMADSLDEGAAHISRALLSFQDLGDDFGRASAHECMAFALGRYGRHRDALGHARKSRKFYGAAGNQTGQASALNNIGCCHAELGDHPRALAYIQRSVRAFRELADPRGEAIALASLGRLTISLVSMPRPWIATGRH